LLDLRNHAGVFVIGMEVVFGRRRRRDLLDHCWTVKAFYIVAVIVLG